MNQLLYCYLKRKAHKDKRILRHVLFELIQKMSANLDIKIFNNSIMIKLCDFKRENWNTKNG